MNLVAGSEYKSGIVRLMRNLVTVFFVAASITLANAVESKTWMHKGCKVHVATGARESSAIGSLMITVASPTGKRATVRADRDGSIAGAWAADLDSDGKFEVIVATRSAGGGNYGKAIIFTWTGADLKKRVVPELSRSQVKGYAGQDQFSVSRNSLFRSMPVFTQKSNDPARKIANKTLRLNLKKFRWEAV